MVIETPHIKSRMAKHTTQQIPRLQTTFVGIVESWRFALLVQSNEGKSSFFSCFGSFIVKEGSQIWFWEDNWKILASKL